MKKNLHKNKLYYKTIILELLILLLLISNNSCENPLLINSNYSFSIYFLKNDKLKIHDVYDKDLNDLKLTSIPWLSDKDIRYYDLSSHCIYLKEDKGAFFPDFKDYYTFPDYLASKPFVVVAGKRRAYVGYFQAIQTSMMTFPHIDAGGVGYYPIDVLPIQWEYIFANDPRYNENIESTLQLSGLYSGGIIVTIDSLWINNDDTTIVTYDLGIRNNSIEDLYILDPLKCDEKVYNYFSTGPVMKNLKNKKIYSAIYRNKFEYVPNNEWSPNWYTKLKANQKIERKLILKGYEFLPNAEYLMEISYNCPIRINKSDRNTSDGRYWIGQTKTEVIQFNISTVVSKRNQLIKYSFKNEF